MSEVDKFQEAREAGFRNAMCTAAVVAFRHIGDVDISERESVLVTLIELLPESEAELAEGVLYHLRESNKKQLKLLGILDAPPARRGRELNFSR